MKRVGQAWQPLTPLSTSIVFTACALLAHWPDHLLKRLPAQKKQKEETPLWAFGRQNHSSDLAREISPSVYPTAVESMGESIYGCDFADIWLLRRKFHPVWCKEAVTWSVDADGKLTITLAGAGSYTATVDSSGRMTIEGSKWLQAVLKQITKTSGDYSSLVQAL